MIVLNRRDGKTERFDLADEAETKRLNVLGADPQAASAITGFALKIEGRSTTLPTPKRFRRVSFFAEVVRDRDGSVVGERLSVQADEIEVSATMWILTDSARVEIWKKGRRVFSPVETEAR